MAMIDALAEQLTKQTGTQFTILRGKNPEGRRYALKAVKGESSYIFQYHRPMKLDELTRLLATLCDAINMGFVPVQNNI